MKQTAKNSTKTRQKAKKTPDEIKAQRIKNLIPGANKNGRPKGKLNYDTRFDLAVEFLANEMVAKHNADPKNKNAQWSLDGIDIENDLFAQAINKARNGSEKMLIDIFDRRYGKATQKVELGGVNGNPIEIAQVELAKSRAKELFNKWLPDNNEKK